MKTILFLIFLSVPQDGELPMKLVMRVEFNTHQECLIAKDRLDKSPPPPNLIMVGSYCENQGQET